MPRNVPSHVSPCHRRNRRPSVAHDVMLPFSSEAAHSLLMTFAPHRRDAARHKTAIPISDVECQSHLVWWPHVIEQRFQASAQIGDRRFLRRAVAKRSHARAELGGGAPNAVLILLDDVGLVDDTSHASSIA